MFCCSIHGGVVRASSEPPENLHTAYHGSSEKEITWKSRFVLKNCSFLSDGYNHLKSCHWTFQFWQMLKARIPVAHQQQVVLDSIMWCLRRIHFPISLCLWAMGRDIKMTQAIGDSTIDAQMPHVMLWGIRRWRGFYTDEDVDGIDVPLLSSLPRSSA